MVSPGAVVIGSGPNGLAAAVTLARAGVSVTVFEARDELGGGTRTAELTLPGLLHDVCSAAHPFGIASPFFTQLPLEDHGLEWVHPEIPLAHPIDGRRAAALHRSLDQTVGGLGVGGPSWRRTFAPLTARFDALAEDVLRPILHVPQHPLALLRFGIPALTPATTYARTFRGDEAAALFVGCAAHAFRSLRQPLTTSVGLMMAAAGHAVGWPVARGGSHAISTALANLLVAEGGKIETGVTIRSLRDLPDANAILFDTSPAAAVQIAGDRLGAKERQALRRYDHGAAAFKLDLAVEDGIPWLADSCRRAGTVHVGGTAAEIAAAERDVHRGRMPSRPFVLVGQQYLADSSRSAGDVHPVWTYAHVPRGYTGDASEAILDQIERFAPGTRDRIVASASMSPAALEAYNPNYVDGDISTGANSMRQLVFRPRFTTKPYTLGAGLYLCSAATPPGAGVHGMCGHHAARQVLTDLGAGG